MLRRIVVELLYKYCEITRVQIETLLGGIDYVSVHQLRRRLKKKMAENMEVKERYEEAEARIKAACIMYNVNRLTENVEISWSRAFRLVKCD